MTKDLQRAGLWKRISAAMFDGVLTFVMALGMVLLIARMVGYDNYANQIGDGYSQYEEQYGVKFNISSSEYEKMTAAEKENFDAAVNELEHDEKIVYAYNMIVSLTLLIVTFSLLLSIVALEFVVPLLFGNGQTLGKKIFGIALMRIEGIKITSLPLFIRTVLGKFTIELMVPIYVILLILMGRMGVVGIAILVVLLIAQIACLAITRVGALLHDVFAGTVAVDMASQRIFESKEELLEYTKKLHAEKAANADY